MEFFAVARDILAKVEETQAEPIRQATKLVADSLMTGGVWHVFGTGHSHLIGEELYASGAYTQAGRMHIASLRAQDVMRWLLVAVIVGGVILNFAGLDELVGELLGGITP